MNFFNYLTNLWRATTAEERASFARNTQADDTDEDNPQFGTTIINNATIDRDELATPLPNLLRDMGRSLTGLVYGRQEYLPEKPASIMQMDLRILRRPTETIVSVKYVDRVTEEFKQKKLRIKKTPGFLPISDPTFNTAIKSHVFDYLDPNSIFTFLSLSHGAYQTITNDYFNPEMLPALWQVKQSHELEIILKEANAGFERKVLSYFLTNFLTARLLFGGTIAISVAVILIAELLEKGPRDADVKVAKDLWQGVFDNCTSIHINCNNTTNAFTFPIVGKSLCTWGIAATEKACEGFDSNENVLSYCQDLVSLGCDLAACNAQHDACDTAEDKDAIYIIPLTLGSLSLGLALAAVLTLRLRDNCMKGEYEMMVENLPFQNIYTAPNVSSTAMLKKFLVDRDYRTNDTRLVMNALRSKQRMLINEFRSKIIVSDALNKPPELYAKHILTTYPSSIFKKNPVEEKIADTRPQQHRLSIN